MQDYIYVSSLKIERLHGSLQSSKRRRLTAIEPSTPIGGLRLELGQGPNSNHAALVEEVSKEIAATWGIRSVRDPLLSAGHWFHGISPDMTYGQAQWDFSAQEAGPAFFTGSDEGCSVLLGGSVQHLLDRRYTDQGARTGSTSERLREVLSKVVAVQDEGRRNTLARPGLVGSRHGDDLTSSASESYHCIDAELSERAGRHRLEYLALAIEVFDDRPGGTRLVLGTPLYVSRLQPVLPAPGPDRPRGIGRRSLFRLLRSNVAAPATTGAARPTRARSPIQAIEQAVPDSVRGDQVRLPSVDIEFYVRPSAVASFPTVCEYYARNPHVKYVGPGPAGEVDFATEDLYWFDDQGGQWIVAFAYYETTEHMRTPASIGDLVATQVDVYGTGEVLLLAQECRLGDIAARLRGYRQAKPRLFWLVNRL
jgi:hypothetical protein